VNRWRAVTPAAALLVAAAVALLGTGLAFANTVTVTNTNDSGPGSLRQAIADAGPGDTIVVPTGTYTLTSGELLITESLTISGAGAAKTIIANGQTQRVFHTAGSGDSITITGVTISNGHPLPAGNLARGGGVWNESATVTLSHDVVTANEADADGAGSGGNGGIAEGGGVASTGGTLNLVDTQVAANSASAVGDAGDPGGIAEGGGVFDTGTLTLDGSTVSSNAADSVGGSTANGGISDGGGLFADGAGATTVSGSTFSGNLADASQGAGASGEAGGIADGGGAFMLTNGPAMAAANITVFGNTARATIGGIASGGGLYFGSNSPVVTLTNATLAGNAAAGGASNEGGDAYLGGATTHVKNTIVAAGTADSGYENCAGAPTSLGHNIDSLDECHFTPAAFDQVNTNPLLGPLHDNGGPAETMALLPGSPAIDAGTNSGCPATDERGVLRPAGAACDIGAFEIATPGASTGAASAVAATTATLNGNAFNPSLVAGTVLFQYGTTTAYGKSTSSRPVTATSRKAPVSAAVSGLQPGTRYHFRLVVTDATGTAHGADRTFTTPSLPAARHRPKLSHLRLSPRALIAASRGGAIAARRTGTTISYTETQPATTTFLVQRPTAGRRAHGGCVRPSPRNHGHARCTRWIDVGSFSHGDRRGRNRFHFTGRVGRHALRAGRYRLRVTPRNAAGAGPTVHARFKVTRR